MNNWIPVIVILAVLAGGGYYAYRKIKRKVEDVSQALFGTDSLVEGWNKQADELAATPKSVSGMTRIFEPQIQRDFPDFNLVQFKNKAENMDFDMAFCALQAKKMFENVRKDISEAEM